MTYSWPVVLKSEALILQALRFRDRPRWNNVRAENRDWLSPWEATIPLIPGDAAENASRLPSYFEMVRTLNSEARSGRSFSFAMASAQFNWADFTRGSNSWRNARWPYWILD